MNSRHELVAAKNRAREEHIRLLNERLTVYMTDPVRFAERLALVRERIRVLQDTPEAFSDSERGGVSINAVSRFTPSFGLRQSPRSRPAQVSLLAHASSACARRVAVPQAG